MRVRRCGIGGSVPHDRAVRPLAPGLAFHPVPPPRPGTAAGRRVCLYVGCGRLRAALCLSGLGTRPLSLHSACARHIVTSVWSETEGPPNALTFTS